MYGRNKSREWARAIAATRLRRTIASGALLAAAAGGVFGAAAASASAGAAKPSARIASSGHPTFAYLQTDGSISYFVLEGQGAKAEGTKLGATVNVENENSSSATTISDIQTAIADGDKGLIVVAPAEQLGPRMVSLAQKAHIPIMASDNGFAGGNKKPVPFVGINASQFGKNTGAILLSNYKKLKWSSSDTYMLLVTNPSLETIQARTNAEQKAALAAGFPKSHIIEESTTDNTTQQAYNATGPIKTAHPQAMHWLVTGGNDDVAYGAAKALVAGGVSASNIDAVGLGGDLACSIWAKGAPNVGFRGTNYIYPNAIGARSVQELYDNVVKHKAFPANSYVAPIAMTKGNLHKIDKACK
ncbi:MAG TPA: substrate-binding domain-containing protein [Solirubrobacteraceae bacterium]|jgi:L-arabinose transport system substrate-binding protein|nr:substrate-binding domain-containing protein [Solirubrobacteraceae bacterium]